MITTAAKHYLAVYFLSPPNQDYQHVKDVSVNSIDYGNVFSSSPFKKVILITAAMVT